MSVAGVLSCLFRQADDRIGVDVDQASGLSDAAAFGEVLEHGAGIWFGQVSLEQGRALALGEAVFAGRTVEQADGVVPAIAPADREVSGVALAVEGAIGFLATEARKVIMGSKRPVGGGAMGSEVGNEMPQTLLRRFPAYCSIVPRHDLFFCKICFDITTRAGSDPSLYCFRWERVGT